MQSLTDYNPRRLASPLWQAAKPRREEQWNVGLDKIRVRWCSSKSNPWLRFIFDTFMKGTSLFVLIIENAPWPPPTAALGLSISAALALGQNCSVLI